MVKLITFHIEHPYFLFEKTTYNPFKSLYLQHKSNRNALHYSFSTVNCYYMNSIIMHKTIIYISS